MLDLHEYLNNDVDFSVYLTGLLCIASYVVYHYVLAHLNTTSSELAFVMIVCV